MENYDIRKYQEKEKIDYSARAGIEIEDRLKSIIDDDFISKTLSREDQNLLDGIRAWKKNKSSE